MPLLWHWLYFLPIHKQSELGADGHAQLGEFLPPVPLSRRMYAGGRVEVRHPLRVGDAIERVSRIADVREKEGRSGPLVFVKVRHQISNRDGLALVEDHDIVYRKARTLDQAGSRPGSGRESEPRRLRRTRRCEGRSALRLTRLDTRDPARRRSAVSLFGADVQRVPHSLRSPVCDRGPALSRSGGPRAADRDAVGRPAAVQSAGAHVSTFSFRAIRPLFDGEPFFACGRPETDGKTVTLWAQDVSGAVAFEATAVLSQVPTT